MLNTERTYFIHTSFGNAISTTLISNYQKLGSRRSLLTFLLLLQLTQMYQKGNDFG